MTIKTRPARSRKRAITLLPVMLAFVSIASLLAVFQAKEMAMLRVQTRLIEVHREAMDRRALQALLTADLARAMIGEVDAPPLDGTAVNITFSGRTWSARFQDVEGLVDLYLAPPDLLTSVGLDATKVQAMRDRLADTMPFGRLASLEQSLAAFEVPAGAETLVTQSAGNGNLRPRTAPAPLRAIARAQPPAFQDQGQTRLARITLVPATTP